MEKKEITNIIKEYQGGDSITVIAERWGRKPEEIYKLLRKKKVKLRRGGWRPRTGRKLLKALRAPIGSPTNPKEGESGKSKVEEFYDFVDNCIPAALETVKNGLGATRLSFGGREFPDWKSRLKAAEIILNKRLPDVKAIEVSGPDGGAVEIDLETRFSELDNSSFSKEFERLLRELGKEPGTEGS